MRRRPHETGGYHLARMNGNMTREISPDDAHSIAPDQGGEAHARARAEEDAAVRRRAESAALARGTHDTGALPALDHAAVHTIMGGIMLAMFLSALEQTIVAPALPAIGKSLGDLDGVSWVVTAYLLAATVATPLFGKLTDIHGRRMIMLTAIGIFIAGSVVCAMAPSMWILIVGRALQGAGGGGLIPIAQIIIADMLSPRERPMAQSYTSVVFLSASVLGPVLGGLLTDHLHWSVIFWINLPLGALAMVMTSRALRRLPRYERPHRLDIPGVALMISAAIALLIALDWGGTHYPWLSWQIVGLIVLSAFLWALTGARLLTAREPFIPIAILGGRITGTITAAGFFGVGTIIGLSIYTPLYCQVVLGVSASLSGIALIGFMIGATSGSFLTGRLITRLKHYMRVPIFGMAVAVALLVFLSIHPAGFSILTFTLLFAALGAAIGPMYQTSTIVMQNAVKPHQMGTATGALNFFRLLGGAIIVAVFGAMVFGGGSRTAGLAVATLAAGHTDFVQAFRMVFIAGAVFVAITLVCLLVVEEVPLSGPVRRAAPAE